MTSTHKTCTKCEETKDISQFGRKVQPNGKPGNHSWCKSCVNVNNNRRRKEDPILHERIKAMHIKHYEGNKEVHKANVQAYREKNREWYRSYQNGYHGLRRARIRGNAYEKGITIDKLFIRDKGICALCGLTCDAVTRSIDHIIPIAKNGPHTWDNVQLAHLRCNQSKNARMIPAQENLQKGAKTDFYV